MGGGQRPDAEPRGPAGTSRPLRGVGSVPTVEPRRARDPGAPRVKVGHTLPAGTWGHMGGRVRGWRAGGVGAHRVLSEADTGAPRTRVEETHGRSQRTGESHTHTHPALTREQDLSPLEKKFSVAPHPPKTASLAAGADSLT